ncbi:MAG: UDP-N-acetylmuramate dehydrogenase [Armatimonadetes bacterium]|nr:UDP-N-acetylmuramate dehydrogenase [Armatimonadota bacterium]
MNPQTIAAVARILPPSVRENEPMSKHTTLRVGGNARFFYPADDLETLAAVLPALYHAQIPYLFVGHGSNLLMSDAGYDGVVIQNRCKGTRIEATGEVYAECGASLGSLFAQTQRAGLAGLEWGIGIPGTVGGALVSNAGAYRGNIGPLVQTVRAFYEGAVGEFGREWLGFSYRDSRLRNETPPRTVVLSVEMMLSPASDPAEVMAKAKQYQAERRAKQPLQPSAGSFFKNVQNRELAERFDDLAPALKDAGVVPTGFLSMKAGCMGWCEGGAMVSDKHGNFLVNAGNATATDFRRLADRVKERILSEYGVLLEEEVLAVGDWGATLPTII